MDSYRVFETENYRKDLQRIAHSGLARLTTKLHGHVYPQLRAEPHFGPNIKRLKNWIPPTWRYRVGSWRFFYEVDENKHIVSMTAADHRGDAY